MEASLGVHNHISFPEVVIININIIIININIIAFILCPTSLLPETQIILVFLNARLPGEAKAKLQLIPGGPQGWRSVLSKVIGQGGTIISLTLKTTCSLDFSFQKCLHSRSKSITGINLPLKICEVTDLLS